ncbi:trace amine-associated receptor 4-like [Protopterus annectens]|uniref:trace amine-associated receptor 4-like n=1 Tax=Protopterus annectens TaxID=7888 RepID=UPI001CFC1FC6|nr:trace amine-associated receptor 4-like [Protopterus annectens]
MNIPENVSVEETRYCFPLVNASCPKHSYSGTVVAGMCFFMICSTLITVSGNLIVIISISHFKCLHSQTNILVCSLAVADLLLGFLVMPYSTIRTVTNCWYFGSLPCKIHSGIDGTLSVASAFHIFFISIDRYYAVCHPLHYSNKITFSVTMMFIGISWATAITYVFYVTFSEVNLVGIEDYVTLISCEGFCSVVFNKVLGVTTFTFAYFIPCTVMTVMYIRIFIVAKRHAQFINNVTEKSKSLEMGQKISSVKERKAAKTLCVIMVTFVVCWTPFYCTFAIDPFLNYTIPANAYDVLVWIAYMNSSLDPIIYGLYYLWFRKALVILFSGKIFHPGSSDINIIT